MADSLLGDVPSRWEQTTLGEVCRRGGGNIQTGPFGSQLHASDYVPSGIPSIMPVNIGDNRIIKEGIACITEQDAIVSHDIAFVQATSFTAGEGM